MLKVYNVKGKKVSNIKKTPAPTDKIDKSEGITKWETDKSNDNDFPQQLLQNVFNSPVGSSAIDLWQEYTQGDGFIESELNTLKVNRKETLYELNSKLSYDLASMWGYAMRVLYNLNGEKTEVYHLPFESARLGALNDDGITDRVYYNPYYGSDNFKKEQTTWYYEFNDDTDFVKDQIATHAEMYINGEVDFEYQGQVYWVSIEKPLARIYPQPFYYSSISWFQIDAKIQEFHSRNIDNNFLLSVLINKFGNPDAPAGKQDADGNPTSTEGEEFDRQMLDYSGSNAGGSVMVNWIQSLEEAAKIEAFPTNSNHDLFITLQNLVTEQICVGTKSPKILLSVSTSGKLGDTQEILNAIKVMQGRTKRLRQMLSNGYSKCITGISGTTDDTDFTIKNSNPIDVMPDWAINSLTDKEKRAYINDNFNIELDEDVVIEETKS